MKFKDMETKIDKDGFRFVSNYIILGKEKSKCLMCEECTEYVDIFSEQHFCSTECLDKFDKEVDKQYFSYLTSCDFE